MSDGNLFGFCRLHADDQIENKNNTGQNKHRKVGEENVGVLHKDILVLLRLDCNEKDSTC